MARVILLLLLSFVVHLASAGDLISDNYDDDFKEAVIFLPAGTDWRLLKAQCYQESRLDPLARSPVGAMGLCQFMPNTAREITDRYPELHNFWIPETSIRAAAIYMNRQLKFWSSPRTNLDRYKLALASYNAGAGNIHQAQKKCNMPLPYQLIIKCLPMVTAHHSIETIGYVKNIMEKWYVVTLFD